MFVFLANSTALNREEARSLRAVRPFINQSLSTPSLVCLWHELFFYTPVLFESANHSLVCPCCPSSQFPSLVTLRPSITHARQTERPPLPVFSHTCQGFLAVREKARLAHSTLVHQHYHHHRRHHPRRRLTHSHTRLSHPKREPPVAPTRWTRFSIYRTATDDTTQPSQREIWAPFFW